MSITQQEKAELVKKYGRGENDTGSTEVQVAILTTRINNLTEHLKTQKGFPLKTWTTRYGWSAQAFTRLSELE